MISREQFISIMGRLERASKLQNDVHRLIINNSDLTDGTDIGIPICHEQIVVDLLSDMFNQGSAEWIVHFMYELDFGKAYKSGCATETYNGTTCDIDISTSGKLYDFLIKKMEINSHE